MTAVGTTPRGIRARLDWRALALAAGSVLAAGAFAWPLFAPALPAQAQAAVPYLAFALAPAVVAALAIALDGQVSSAKTVALLGVLGAIGAATRVAGDVVGGIEPVFVVLILAGRALGARFGFLLGLVVMTVSAVITGGVGPWLPFQLFACAWVAAGAGLLPRIRSKVGELVLLAGYGAVASWLVGALLNLWFWPFQVGEGASISYDPHASLGHNLTAFALYSLVTSTLTWDTVRAITTVVGIALVGCPVLAALRRAKL
ncbi:ECF transporter S component [Gryllotalpicola ginsengisoli]|uniref:ECF transporter S component n=1 Tax=Gryllotalpicola ginsengisoli TaxID=444608 RepID=UPI00040E3165|nr:ECF transporter S component [Gryllotalpicola ginsengisoli]